MEAIILRQNVLFAQLSFLYRRVMMDSRVGESDWGIELVKFHIRVKIKKCLPDMKSDIYDTEHLGLTFWVSDAISLTFGMLFATGNLLINNDFGREIRNICFSSKQIIGFYLMRLHSPWNTRWIGIKDLSLRVMF